MRWLVYIYIYLTNAKRESKNRARRDSLRNAKREKSHRLGMLSDMA